MVTFLNKIANEKGAILLNVIFRDERRREIVPKTSAFQLMKLDRSVVNNRSFANGTFTGNKVVLHGEDLAIFGDSDTRFRLFSVEATYDSTYGDDLPCNCEVEFVIRRMMGQEDIVI